MKTRLLIVCFVAMIGLISWFGILPPVQASRTFISLNDETLIRLTSNKTPSWYEFHNDFGQGLTPVLANGGPYELDDHTLLLVHFDGDYSGVMGEPATISGTTFVDGFFDQGVLINAGDTLTYTTAGNLDKAMGTIEFWVRPNWQGDDGQMHIFFETGPNADSGIQIGKDSIGTLHFIIWKQSDLSDVVYNITDWHAGEWHHIVASWQAQKMILNVDGQRTEIFNTVGDLDAFGTSLFIGSSPNLGWEADAVMDELRIRDLPILEIWLPLVIHSHSLVPSRPTPSAD